ncbi:MAG: HAMP domain-containing histidine kinase [Gammaproteobacteria bacterium]|nr:HAMP domain-containing histidine kinase [Gammaproteobacteria bacterium]
MIELQDFVFFEGLLGVAEQKSSEAPELIVALAMKRYPLTDCSFYTYNDYDKALYLRAGLGHLSEIYRFPHTSTMGRAIHEEKTIVIENVKEEPGYPYKDLINKSKIRSLVAVPLPISEPLIEGGHQFTPDFCGVLCLYPKISESLKEIKNSITQLAPLISRAYVLSVKNDKIQIRDDIVSSAVSSKDLSSLLYRAVHVLRDKWSVEAASVYILDERSNTLRLKGTTGLEHHPRKESVFFTREDHDDLVKIFNTGKVKIITPESGRERYVEETMLPRWSILYVPIFEPPRKYATRKGVGVIKLINRVLQMSDNKKESIVFGWEDMLVSVYLADILSVLTFMSEIVSQTSDDFENAIHGINNNLWTVLGALGQLQDRGNIESLLPERFHYIVPDSIGHLEALQWQIGKFSDIDFQGKLKHNKVYLFGEVIAKAVVIKKMLAHYFNVTLHTDDIHDENMLDMPPVKGDIKALTTVFRNLIENAIKYTAIDSKCKMHIWWEEAPKSVKVYFEDWGIGIEERDTKYIFGEGYRAEEAMRRVTSGGSAGLGLHQCKNIMTELGGSISLVNRQDPTKFLVTIPKWR